MSKPTCQGGCWISGWDCIHAFQSVQPNPAGVVVAALGTLLTKPEKGPASIVRDCRGNILYRTLSKEETEKYSETLREMVV